MGWPGAIQHPDSVSLHSTGPVLSTARQACPDGAFRGGLCSSQAPLWLRAACKSPHFCIASMCLKVLLLGVDQSNSKNKSCSPLHDRHVLGSPLQKRLCSTPLAAQQAGVHCHVSSIAALRPQLHQGCHMSSLACRRGRSGGGLLPAVRWHQSNAVRSQSVQTLSPAQGRQ